MSDVCLMDQCGEPATWKAIIPRNPQEPETHDNWIPCCDAHVKMFTKEFPPVWPVTGINEDHQHLRFVWHNSEVE